MTDENYNALPVECWPRFTDGQVVTGMRLLSLIDWVSTSIFALDGNARSEVPVIASGMPIIAMPPVQRTSVWRPKQVLDLWDSLMRGLPIGTFYLVEPPAGKRKLIPFGSVETRESGLAGFDLLDGQQRVRALLLGADGSKDEKRCLWIDLGSESAKTSPCLRLTSKAQPFGYEPKTGSKLRVNERRQAREDIEPAAHPILCKREGQERPAYDLDLFDGEGVIQNGGSIVQPPLPYGATKGRTFKLHELLAAWRKRSSSDPAGGINALRLVVGSSENLYELEAALGTLDGAFRRVEESQVALLRIDPATFLDPRQDLLALFDRTGAGGTPLSPEERLFSIYKHHRPEIRDAVDAIYRQAGRVLPPTKIVATALRIANASTPKAQTNTPDVADFAARMSADPPSDLRKELDKLIPTSLTSLGSSNGIFGKGFLAVKRLLSYGENANDFWMPDVLLTTLPAEAWQVLVFWVTRRLATRPSEELPSCREEMVRFALFWILCVWNNEKAASWAFGHVKEMGDAGEFPGAALYKRLIGTVDSDRCAYALIRPCEFTSRLTKEFSPIWRTDKERFGVDPNRNEIGALWWWNGRKILPWLQREYLGRVFPGYAPLTDHEDDLPYDVDHICPYSEWGADWRDVQKRVVEPGASRDAMKAGRDAVGNGIGNLRLVESSTNRHDQDDDLAVKMPFILGDGAPSACNTRAMVDVAFSPQDRECWRKVSRAGPMAERKWENERLAAFQVAVERRAAWLYQCYYDGLGYSAWNST